MKKQFQIHLFGKKNCQKCSLLKKRLSRILEKGYSDKFDMVYHDVETEDGLVEFAKTECMNPQRIPGFAISKWNIQLNRYEYLPQSLTITPASKRLLFSILGVQTDYSEQGKGIIPPELLENMLIEAKKVGDKISEHN